MKSFAALTVASLASPAAADFQIYYLNAWALADDTGQREYTALVQNDPDCNDIYAAIPHPLQEDVSFSGVSCEPCQRNEGSMGITELEANAMGEHFTLRESGSWQMTPADEGPLLGWCRRDGDEPHTVFCSRGVSNIQAERLFICDSDLTME